MLWQTISYLLLFDLFVVNHCTILVLTVMYVTILYIIVYCRGSMIE